MINFESLIVGEIEYKKHPINLLLIDSILYCPSLNAMSYNLFKNCLIFKGFLLYMLQDQSEYSRNYIQFIIICFIIYYYRYNSFIYHLNLKQLTHNSIINYYYFFEIYNYRYFFKNKYRISRIKYLLLVIIYLLHFLIIRKNFILYYFLYFNYFYNINLNFKFNFIYFLLAYFKLILYPNII